MGVCIVMWCFCATFYRTDEIEKAIGVLVISATILVQLHRERQGQLHAEQLKQGPTAEEQEDDDIDRIIQLANLLQTPDEAAVSAAPPDPARSTQRPHRFFLFLPERPDPRPPSTRRNPKVIFNVP